MFHFPIFAQRLIDLKSGEADSESLMSHEVRRCSLQSGWSGWSSWVLMRYLNNAPYLQAFHRMLLRDQHFSDGHQVHQGPLFLQQKNPRKSHDLIRSIHQTSRLFVDGFVDGFLLAKSSLCVLTAWIWPSLGKKLRSLVGWLGWQAPVFPGVVFWSPIFIIKISWDLASISPLLSLHTQNFGKLYQKGQEAKKSTKKYPSIPTRFWEISRAPKFIRLPRAFWQISKTHKKYHIFRRFEKKDSGRMNRFFLF